LEKGLLLGCYGASLGDDEVDDFLKGFLKRIESGINASSVGLLASDDDGSGFDDLLLQQTSNTA